MCLCMNSILCCMSIIPSIYTSFLLRKFLVNHLIIVGIILKFACSIRQQHAIPNLKSCIKLLYARTIFFVGTILCSKYEEAGVVLAKLSCNLWTFFKKWREKRYITSRSDSKAVYAIVSTRKKYVQFCILILLEAQRLWKWIRWIL